MIRAERPAKSMPPNKAPVLTALAALLFLYVQVLAIPLAGLGEFTRAKRPQRVPSVLAPARCAGPEVPQRGTRMALAVGLPRDENLRRRSDRPGEATSPSRDGVAAGRPRCSARSKAVAASELPHAQAQLRDAFAGGRV